MEPMHVRFAALDDAPAICTIYNQGIDDRVATLETELRDAEERRRWLASRGTRYPVIVAEARGQIIGWSSLNSFNPRRAYDHVADLSVYVERTWRGRGAGRVLLERLLELGRGLHFHKLRLACFATNKAQVAEAVSVGKVDRGLLICGTGIGMSIAANKVPGIRAALCSDVFTARMSREHNDANVLALGGRLTGRETGLDILRAWLETSFAAGRHARRVDKIAEMERGAMRARGGA